MNKSSSSANWIEFTSASGEVIFYYNRVTKERRWAQVLRARPFEIKTSEVLKNVSQLLEEKISPFTTREQLENIVSAGAMIMEKKLQSKSKEERLVALSKLTSFAHQVLASKQMSVEQTMQQLGFQSQSTPNSQSYQSQAMRNSPSYQSQAMRNSPSYLSQAISNSLSYQSQAISNSPFVTTSKISLVAQGGDGLTISQGYSTGLQGYQGTPPCSQTYGNQNGPAAILCGNNNIASNSTTSRLCYKALPTANNNTSTNCSSAIRQILLQKQKPSFDCQTTTICESNSEPFYNFQRKDQFCSTTIGTQDLTTVNTSSETSVGHHQVLVNQRNKHRSLHQTQGDGQQELSTSSIGVSDVRQTYQNDQARDRKTMTLHPQSALGDKNIGRNTLHRSMSESRLTNVTTARLENSPNVVNTVKLQSSESVFLGGLPYLHKKSVQNGNPQQELYQSKQSLLLQETIKDTIDRETTKQQFVVHMDSSSLNPGVVVNTTVQSESIDVLPRVASVVSLAPLSTEKKISNKQQEVDGLSSIGGVFIDLTNTANFESFALQTDNAITGMNDHTDDTPNKNQFVEKIHLPSNLDLSSAGEQTPTSLSEARRDSIKLATLKANTKNVVDIDKTFKNSPTVAQIEPNSTALERVEEVIATPTSTQSEPSLRVLEREEELKTPMQIKIEPDQNQDQTSCDAHNQDIAITECEKNVQMPTIGEVSIKMEREEPSSTPFTSRSQDAVSFDETVTNSRQVVKTEPSLNSCGELPNDNEDSHLSDRSVDCIPNCKIPLHGDFTFTTVKTEPVSEPNMVIEENERSDIVQSKDSFDLTPVLPLKSELSEEQTPSCLVSVAEQSLNQNANSKSSDNTEDSTPNHHGQCQTDKDFQCSVTEDTNEIESSPFNETILKTELIDTGLAPTVTVEVSEEEDNEESSEMFSLLDYLPAKRLRLITDENVNEMDVSSIEAETNNSSSLDGEIAGDSNNKEMSLDSPKTEKRKLKTKIVNSPTKKRKEDHVYVEAGVTPTNDLISNNLENCQSRRFSSELNDNSSCVNGSSVLCCQECGTTFTEPIALQGHDCVKQRDSCGKDFASLVNFETHACKVQGKPVQSVSPKSNVSLQLSLKRGAQNSLLQKCRLEAGELTHNMRSHGRKEKNGKRNKKINGISSQKLNHSAKGNDKEGAKMKEAELHERSEKIPEIKIPYSCQDIDNSRNYRDKLRCKKNERIKQDSVLKKRKNHTKQKNAKNASDGRFNRKRQTIDKRFKCTHCCKAFRYSSNLSKHLRGHSGDQLQCNSSGAKPSRLSKNCSVRKNQYECSQCQKSFATLKGLKLHKKTHDSQYQCEECEKRFSEMTLLTEHQKLHDSEKLYVCNFCDKSFKHKNSLRIHKYRNHRDLNFVCSKCNESFGSEKALERHNSSHVVISTFNCEYCSKIFHLTEVYKHHLKKYHESNKEDVEGDDFKCLHCDKHYSTSYRLKKHMIKHSGKNVKCNVCSKVFIDNHDLKKHARTHTGDRPYKCSECNWAFSQSSQLNRHLRCVHGKGKKIPSGLYKRFSCDICSREFSDLSHLQRHFQIHTGVKPFSCEFCNAAFREKHHLSRHFKTCDSRKKKSNKESTASANRRNEENQGDATMRGKDVAVTVPMAADVRGSVLSDGNQEEMKRSPLNEKKRKSRFSSVRSSQKTENLFFPSQSSSLPSKSALLKQRRVSSDNKSMVEASKEQSQLDSQVTEQSTVPFQISSTKEPSKIRSFQTEYTPASIEEKQTDSLGQQPSISAINSDEKKQEEVESIVEKILQKNIICQKSPQRRNESPGSNQQSKLALRLIEPRPLTQNPSRKLQTLPKSPMRFVAAVKDKNSISSEKMCKLKRTMELRRQLSFGNNARPVGESIPSGEGKEAKTSITTSKPVQSSSEKYLEQKIMLAQKTHITTSEAMLQKGCIQQDRSCQMETLSKASVVATTTQLTPGNNDGIAGYFNSGSAVSFDHKNLQKQYQFMGNCSAEQLVTNLPPESRCIKDISDLGFDDKKSSLAIEVTSFKKVSKRSHGEENECKSFEDKEDSKKASRTEELDDAEIDQGDEKGNPSKKIEGNRGKEELPNENVNEEHWSYLCEQKEYRIENPANHFKNGTNREFGVHPAKAEEIKDSTENVSQVVAIEKNEDWTSKLGGKEIDVTVDGIVGYRETEEDISKKENDAAKLTKIAWPTQQEEKKEVNKVDHKQLKKSCEDENEENHHEIKPSCQEALKESERDKGRSVQEKPASENVMHIEKDYEDTINLEPKDMDLVNEMEKYKELKGTENIITENENQNELIESTAKGNREKVAGTSKETLVGDKSEVRSKSKQKQTTNDKFQKSERKGNCEEVNKLHENDKEENHRVEQTSKTKESQGILLTRPSIKSRSETNEICKNICADHSQKCSEVPSTNTNSPRSVNFSTTIGKGKTAKDKKLKIETRPLVKSRSSRDCVKLSSRCHPNTLQKKHSSSKTIVNQYNPKDSRAPTHSNLKDRNSRNTSHTNGTLAYKRKTWVSPSQRSTYTRRSSPARDPRQQKPKNIFKHFQRQSRRYRSPSPERQHGYHNYRSKERFPAHCRDGMEPKRWDDYRNDPLIRRKRMFAQDDIGSHPVKRRWEEKRFPSQFHRKYRTNSRFHGERVNDSADIPPLLPEGELHEIMSQKKYFSEDDRQFSDQGYKRDERSGSRYIHNHHQRPRDRIEREEMPFSNERPNHNPHQRLKTQQ